MNDSESKLAPRLRLAGALLIVGLLAEALTLMSFRPLAFLAFVLVGGLLIALGILLYFYSLVRLEPPAR